LAGGLWEEEMLIVDVLPIMDWINRIMGMGFTAKKTIA
jgi:hypothetical protein